MIITLTSDLLVETANSGGGGGFIDNTYNTEDIQAGDVSGVLGGLTLRTVEVCGDSGVILALFIVVPRYNSAISFILTT
jgi:hypothetical protein